MRTHVVFLGGHLRISDGLNQFVQVICLVLPTAQPDSLGMSKMKFRWQNKVSPRFRLLGSLMTKNRPVILRSLRAPCSRLRISSKVGTLNSSMLGSLPFETRLEISKLIVHLLRVYCERPSVVFHGGLLRISDGLNHFVQVISCIAHRSILIRFRKWSLAE